jgi:hypothetical protein
MLCGACSRLLKELDVETIHDAYFGANHEFLRPLGLSSVLKCTEEQLVPQLL